MLGNRYSVIRIKRGWETIFCVVDVGWKESDSIYPTQTQDFSDYGKAISKCDDLNDMEEWYQKTKLKGGNK